MQKLSTLIWTLVVVVAAFMLYTVKYQVQTLKLQAAQTSRELEEEKEALHVVAAEWAYLNRPERLEQLSARYLASSDVTVDQVADIEAIPFPAQTQAMLDNEEGVRPVAMKMRRDKR